MRMDQDHGRRAHLDAALAILALPAAARASLGSPEAAMAPRCRFSLTSASRKDAEEVGQ